MTDVLIVDDDQDLAEVLQFLLENKGYHVRCAVDGQDGLRLLHETHPDVIILDVEMPKLSGPDMVHRILLHDAGWENIPVILVSGVVDLPLVARSIGVPYYLAKPYSVPSFWKLLERALSERKTVAPEPTP